MNYIWFERRASFHKVKKFNKSEVIVGGSPLDEFLSAKQIISRRHIRRIQFDLILHSSGAVGASVRISRRKFR